jgi:hypothetical protein
MHQRCARLRGGASQGQHGEGIGLHRLFDSGLRQIDLIEPRAVDNGDRRDLCDTRTNGACVAQIELATRERDCRLLGREPHGHRLPQLTGGAQDENRTLAGGSTVAAPQSFQTFGV